MPSVLALFAHPDDIEIYAAGTMLQLAGRGWDLHYCNLCAGNGGSLEMDGPTTATKRLGEAQAAAAKLGAKFYPPIVNDMTLTYEVETLRRVAGIIRTARPDIILTHALSDYMEDHMTCARLAVSGAFTHGMPNFDTVPPTPTYEHDVVIYHAMPHGLRDPLRQRVRAGLYVDTTLVHLRKRDALAAHESQKAWLDASQGMDSYLVTMDETSQAVGQLSGQFVHAEGWRRHLHLGFSAVDHDPLRRVLGADCLIDAAYEASLENPQP